VWKARLNSLPSLSGADAWQAVCAEALRTGSDPRRFFQPISMYVAVALHRLELFGKHTNGTLVVFGRRVAVYEACRSHRPLTTALGCRWAQPAATAASRGRLVAPEAAQPVLGFRCACASPGAAAERRTSACSCWSLPRAACRRAVPKRARARLAAGQVRPALHRRNEQGARGPMWHAQYDI
jgi:hypothetical protein